MSDGLLRAWLDRELTALMYTTDNTVVTAFVMGLVNSHQAFRDHLSGAL